MVLNIINKLKLPYNISKIGSCRINNISLILRENVKFLERIKRKLQFLVISVSGECTVQCLS